MYIKLTVTPAVRCSLFSARQTDCESFPRFFLPSGKLDLISSAI